MFFGRAAAAVIGTASDAAAAGEDAGVVGDVFPVLL